MQTHVLLTRPEREFIAFRIRLKCGVREIGRRLGRSHSVITREIAVNGGCKKYDAEKAQLRADRAKRKRGRKKKLDTDEALHDHVVREIRKGMAPHVIAGRLTSHPRPQGDKLFRKTISHETIYRYIYEGEGRWEGLYHHLPYRRRKRQKQYQRKHREKTGIVERISIHARPEEINKRSSFGHWESDSVIYQKQKAILSVQVERRSRLLRFHRAVNKTAEETETALRRTIDSLPQELFKTMTFDNGTEGANHRKIRDEFGIITYFCDTYSSWQKGSVENINGIIRRFLPKTKDLSILSDREIHEIQERINDTPRKLLGYRTPNEVIRQYLDTVVR